MFDIVIVLIVLYATIAECKYCWHTTSFGKSTHFYCGAFEYCCGDECCENFDEFYKLWYFWLCILILVLSSCIALYWLRRRYLLQQCQPPETIRTRQRGRRHRRYRQLTGDSNGAPPEIVSVVIAPPPYMGDNSGCPHPGPPPYSLGSGSSINSQTLPRFPPSYEQIATVPPPSYNSIVKVIPENNEKKGTDNEDPEAT